MPMYYLYLNGKDGGITMTHWHYRTLPHPLLPSCRMSSGLSLNVLYVHDNINYYCNSDRIHSDPSFCSWKALLSPQDFSFRSIIMIMSRYNHAPTGSFILYSPRRRPEMVNAVTRSLWLLNRSSIRLR